MEKEYKYLVCTRCFTFNHAPYIVDAMNGFTMQKTTFPVVTVIVDDASTDGEQDVIRQYLNDYFQEPFRTEETEHAHIICANHKFNPNCQFVVLLLKYNHHSNKISKLPYIAIWFDNAKYHALCEGDDYWIDSHKLQMQVDFLESNPDYTMTCNRTQRYSVRQKKMIGENYCYENSQEINPKDIIYRTGLFISTCSIVYRKWVTDNKPDYWQKCKVGDYPLQIACAMKGKTYYFNQIMSVYRVQNPKSWTGQQKWKTLDKQLMEVLRSLVEMLKGFRNDYPGYKDIFTKKIVDEINRNIPKQASSQDYKQYFTYFAKDISQYSLRGKLDMYFRTCRIPKVKGLYAKFFLEKYNQKCIGYD